MQAPPHTTVSAKTYSAFTHTTAYTYAYLRQASWRSECATTATEADQKQATTAQVGATALSCCWRTPLLTTALTTLLMSDPGLSEGSIVTHQQYGACGKAWAKQCGMCRTTLRCVKTKPATATHMQPPAQLTLPAALHVHAFIKAELDEV